MPLLVSSNWAAWLLGLGVFLFYEIIALIRQGWQEMRRHWTENFLMGLLATTLGYLVLFGWSILQTTYDEHRDSTGRWRVVVNEKDHLKAELSERDTYIRKLEARSCPICPARAAQVAESQPSALSDLQRTVLMRDLKAGSGLSVRINSIGNRIGVTDYANELQEVFKGWVVERNIVGNLSTNIETSTAQIEFVIPQPQDRSVQIAVHAFDHARVSYSKTVNEYAYRGPSSSATPALTINVR